MEWFPMDSRRSESARFAEACWITVLLVVGSLGSGCYAMGKARGTLGIFDQRDPRVLYSVETEEPLVALTIDDGPDPATTPRILAVLEANGARATFFIPSQRVAGNEAVVDAIHEAGHEIANHHRRDLPSIDLPPDQFVADLEESHRVLSRWSVPRWFRPGSGWYHDWMLEILDDRGYQVALGSIYPLDAQIPWSGFAAWLIRWRAKPGAIIILHDRGARGERTARTLERVLPELEQRGYRVVALSELVAAAGGDAPSPTAAGPARDR
jgi:peptidoglycan/xylan/chitin deacetylase (PgdA/CDA1 family)